MYYFLQPPKPSGGTSGGFVVPPPLPQQGPAGSATIGGGSVPFDDSASAPFNKNPASMSYNIPPGGDSSSNVNNMQVSFLKQTRFCFA